MYTICNDQIRVISISSSWKIYHFCMLKIFRFFFSSDTYFINIWNTSWLIDCSYPTPLQNTKTNSSYLTLFWYSLSILFPFPSQPPSQSLVTITPLSYEIDFLGFHKWVRTYSMFLSVPGWFYLACYASAPFTLLQLTGFNLFWLNWPITCTLYFLNHYSVDGHLGWLFWFCILGAVCNTLINIGIRVSLI
jgi:hypothetical protein